MFKLAEDKQHPPQYNPRENRSDNITQINIYRRTVFSCLQRNTLNESGLGYVWQQYVHM